MTKKAAYQKALHEKRVREHKCVRCGSDLPDDYAQKTCQFCLARQKALNEAKRFAERCLRCGEKDAYTMNGHIYCAECTEWYKEYARARTAGNRQAINERIRVRTAERRQNGECIVCGVKLADNSVYAMCEKCRQKHKAYRRKAYEAEGHISRTQAEYMGLCKRCCHEPMMDGKKLCKKCYSSLMKATAAAAELRKKRHDEARAKRIARESGETNER